MLVDYINASNQVCRYAVSINTTQLPALVTPPANYGNFVQTFAKANLDVMGWIKEVVPDFNDLPGAFINYNGLFQQQIATVQGYLTQLKANPSDPVILQNIRKALNTLITEAETCANTVSGLYDSITDYQGTIAPDDSALGGLCNQITAAEKVDQSSIDQMNAVLANLQSLVNARNELVTLNKLANITEGIFIAMVGVGVGVVFTGGVGLIIGIGFGVGSAVFTTLVPAGSDIDYQQTLQDIQNEMDNVNTEIGLIASTVALLQSLDNQFTQIIAQSGIAQKNIQTVLDFWQQVQADAAQVVEDLEAILAEQNIDQAISDLHAATAAWNAIEGYMQNIISVKYNINPAVFMAPSVPAKATATA